MLPCSHQETHRIHVQQRCVCSSFACSSCSLLSPYVFPSKRTMSTTIGATMKLLLLSTFEDERRIVLWVKDSGSLLRHLATLCSAKNVAESSAAFSDDRTSGPTRKNQSGNQSHHYDACQNVKEARCVHLLSFLFVIHSQSGFD
jgi:hypothetical protein